MLLEHHGTLCRTIEQMHGESEELSRQFKANYIKRLEAMLEDARGIEVGSRGQGKTEELSPDLFLTSDNE